MTSEGGAATSLVAQVVKNLPAMQEIWVWFLGWEDPLEKGMATHFSILAWRIPQTEEPRKLQSMELKRDEDSWMTNTLTFTPLLKIQDSHMCSNYRSYLKFS